MRRLFITKHYWKAFFIVSYENNPVFPLTIYYSFLLKTFRATIFSGYGLKVLLKLVKSNCKFLLYKWVTKWNNIDNEIVASHSVKMCLVIGWSSQKLGLVSLSWYVTQIFVKPNIIHKETTIKTLPLKRNQGFAFIH